MPFSGVIFDCDGTLVDTEPLANDVFATMLSAEGLPITGHEAMTRFRGKKWAVCLAEVEAELGRKLPDGFMPELHERTSEAYRTAQAHPRNSGSGFGAGYPEMRRLEWHTRTSRIQPLAHWPAPLFYRSHFQFLRHWRVETRARPVSACGQNHGRGTG